MSSVQFARFTEEEETAVQKIVLRARALYATADIDVEPLTLRMNLSAAHATIPLRLRDMAEADDLNLMHDVDGIARYLDRDTGKLTKCFGPRFATRADA